MRLLHANALAAEVAVTKPIAKPESELVCPGVLDGSDLGVLNTNLRARGVSDNDRFELLKFAQLLQTKVPSKP